jgi:hypothetical protein
MTRTQENLPDIYFDSNKGCYWLKDSTGTWISHNEHQIERLMRSHKISPKPNGGFTSALDEKILHIQNQCSVQYAGPLAGYKAGAVEINGQRILVTSSPKLVMPVPAEWATLEKFIRGLLADPEHDQVIYLYGWLKIALESLHSETIRPGQVFVICGPKDCGKSLLQNLITVLLGGRVAQPYPFMCGKTCFNAELFYAEHLAMADEYADTKLSARREFGSKIKALTVNEDQWCHGKNRTGITLRPFWRITNSLNDEAENLMQLPPLDDGVTDKLILTKANKFQMPMPTATVAQRKAFMDRLLADLPGFVDFLFKLEIPEKLVSERFGITHFHHPEIIQQLDSLAPEVKLLKIIDAALFRSNIVEWKGTAEDLEEALSNQPNARRLFTFDTAYGVYLSRLADKFPARISRHRSAEKRVWVIKRMESEASPCHGGGK